MGSKRFLITVLVVTMAAGAVACDDDKAADASASDTGDVSDTAEQAKTKAKPAPQASDETPHPRATSPGGATIGDVPPLNISSYLTTKDVRGLTAGAVVREPLRGQKPSPTYNAIHLHPGGRDFYGAGLQVWKLDSPKDAAKRLTSLRAQYLAVKDAPQGAPMGGDEGSKKHDQAFVSERAGIKTYVFVPATAQGPGYVAAVSCGHEFCKKGWDDVFEMAKKVEQRLTK